MPYHGWLLMLVPLSKVHACLYFIAAHRLKGADIEFMKRLQPYVNIVPVIAKSDAMTVGERDAFRQISPRSPPDLPHISACRRERRLPPPHSLGAQGGVMCRCSSSRRLQPN